MSGAPWIADTLLADILPLVEDKATGDLPSYRFLLCYRTQVCFRAPDSDLLERLDLCDTFWMMATVDAEFASGGIAKQQGPKMAASLSYLLDNKVPFTIAVNVQEIDDRESFGLPRRFAMCVYHVRIVEKEQAALYKLFNR